MSKNINKCLDDLRYAYKYKVPLGKVFNSYGTYADPQQISKETFKNFCLFVYKTELDNDEILKNLEKYSDYVTFINNQGNFKKFFIERTPIKKVPKKKIKKYTTYSAHGHFQTNNPISVFLNYIAILPAYLLTMILACIGKIFENFFNLSKSNKKKIITSHHNVSGSQAKK
ncbi:hypothetical protein KAU19_07200 [Candidatus Parcubacteria bacterium]|nr:hypothetical protein [Candidatus Parcubacteria bacterium]